ncbi:MAG: hypothetical protein ACRD3B_12195 [Candidatus Sulfotelmatobacter sp.]
MTTPCPACGNSMNVEDRFCRVCGRQTAGIAQVSAGPGFVGPPATSLKATISLVCGLLFFIPLAFTAAIVFGHLSAAANLRQAAVIRVDMDGSGQRCLESGSPIH